MRWALLLLAGGGIFSFGLQTRQDAGKKTAPPSPRGSTGPVTVTTAAAVRGNIGVYLDAIGIVTPVYTASITPQANGVVTAVNYAEGQMVRPGDPLVDIDPRQYQAQLLQAQGTLEHDTYLLAQARMDLERYRAAWARNAIQKQTLDDQEKLVPQLEGTVKSDQGAAQYAAVQLGYCHITAPIAGRVGLRLLDPGNVVQATSITASTSALVVITQIQPITVVFTLAEDSIGQVRAQMRNGSALPVDAYDRAQLTRIASGKLAALDNQIDTTTGTAKLRALFSNKDEALFPNQFVNTRLLVKTLSGVTLIPTNAVQHNGNETFVYMIRNDTAYMQAIKTGAADSGLIAVEGIKPGDVVATSSFDKLQNNSKVVLSNQPASSAGGSKPR